MKRQKKKQNGITLIALVISIIVMLILAGVSLNATVGENGIVTKAQEAALKQRVSEELENLNLELTKINVDTIATDEVISTQDLANYLISKGVIDSVVKTSTGQIAAGIDSATRERYFFGNKGDNTYKIQKSKEDLLSAELTTNSSGGDITGGYALITAESFNNDNSLPEAEKGKFTITSDAEVVFMDTVTGALSIKVNSGVHATVGIYANMSLTNSNIKRSAIEIEPTGKLDIYIDDGVSLEVNSGIGENALGNTPGKGGYAGIHVPENAVLNIKGEGTIIAIGGNAGNGGNGNSAGSTNGVAGGGGAGAGIGGNGGNGSSGAIGSLGTSGGNGGNCGKINIYDEVTVYAYGGGGGKGGNGHASKSIGGGSGGYPGAGIGGGGAGGAGATDCSGAGGYTGGTGRVGAVSTENGLAGAVGTYPTLSGGGYFQGGIGKDTNGLSRESLCLGGFQAFGLVSDGKHKSGNGGNAGAGGIVQVHEDSKIYAFNGNLFTDGTDYNQGINQCPIYIQTGVTPARYSYVVLGKGGDWIEYFELDSSNIVEQKNNVTVSGYINKLYNINSVYNENKIININDKLEINTNSLLTAVDMSRQGVGSGAGYIETSNGSYKEYKQNSNGQLIDVNGNIIE